MRNKKQWMNNPLIFYQITPVLVKHKKGSKCLKIFGLSRYADTKLVDFHMI